MKKNRFLIIVLTIVISFCIFSSKVMAITTKGDCSSYFKYNDVVYDEENAGWIFGDNVYVKNSSNAKIFVGGNPKGETYHGDTNDETVTSAFYFSACYDVQCVGGHSPSHLLNSDLKLIVNVYAKDSQSKLCTWSISGFNSNKSRVKVMLQHQGIAESVTMSGYFTYGNSTTNISSVNLVIKNTTTKLNTENATKAANSSKIVKQTRTNKNGEIIIDSGTSCSDVKDLIHDYWKYVMIIAPILLIVLVTIDFFKAVVSGDADAITKSTTNAVKRTIATIILLALPALLGFIFSIFELDFCV